MSEGMIDFDPTITSQSHETRARIDQQRENKNLNALQKKQRIAHTVFQHMQENGKFFIEDGQYWYFSHLTESIIAIDERNRELLSYIAARYGLNKTERLAKYVLEDLQNRAATTADTIRTATSAHYDGSTNTLYLDSFGDVLMITVDGIKRVTNGTDDVFFRRDDDWQPWHYDENVSTRCINCIPPIPINTANRGQRHSTAQLALMRVWSLALFFPELMPVRPILVLHGDAASGKTTVLRCIGRLIFGEQFDVSTNINDQRDFEVAMANCHLVVLDNVDSYEKWRMDSLANASTGGNTKRRKLYSDNELIISRPRAFLALTTRTPKFKRDDVVSRLLLINLSPLDEFITESEIAQSLSKERDRIMSSIAHTLQLVLKELEKTDRREISAKSRLADFSAFAIRIAPALGINRRHMQAYAESMTADQSDFLIECQRSGRFPHPGVGYMSPLFS